MESEINLDNIQNSFIEQWKDFYISLPQFKAFIANIDIIDKFDQKTKKTLIEYKVLYNNLLDGKLYLFYNNIIRK